MAACDCRTRWAAEDLSREAHRQPRQLKVGVSVDTVVSVVSVVSVVGRSFARLLKEGVILIQLLFQPKKKKNVEFNDLGDRLGRVHMERQDFGQLQTRKMKGLKRSAKDRSSEGENGNAMETSA